MYLIAAAHHSEERRNGKLKSIRKSLWGLTENYLNPRRSANKISKLHAMDKQKDQADYYTSLPRKRMGSGVIIRNSKGEMLVLKTTHQDHWEIPGGVVEKDESPRQTAEREVREEIGLALHISACLVIHYRAAQGKQDENIMFVFDGGVIRDETKFRLDNKEISEAKFVSFQDAVSLVGERIASRLPYCERAIEEKRTIYLESIETLDPIAF